MTYVNEESGRGHACFCRCRYGPGNPGKYRLQEQPPAAACELVCPTLIGEGHRRHLVGVGTAGVVLGLVESCGTPCCRRRVGERRGITVAGDMVGKRHIWIEVYLGKGCA